MPDLIVNTANLRDLSTQLNTVHRTLANAEGDAKELAGMIPHDGLAGAVESFTNDWDRRRKDLTEQVDALHQRAKGVADAFEGTDDQLADKLEEAS